ncbi:hypothetical protein [Lentzea sp. NBRC 102530]|uniref:hypothetical protein n=1 Tax=Lentzea sp. NBRC 102530 TaxID=3032201 RepID=UPI0025575D69|nr:hypothetical protein [Lentzea sp. NBRC 102530]
MDQLASALVRIVRVEDDLDITMSRQARIAKRISGARSAERPSPLVWTGSEARRALVDTVSKWSRYVANRAGIELDLDAVVVPPPQRHARAHLTAVPAEMVALYPEGPHGKVVYQYRDARRHDDPASLPYQPGPAARAARWLLAHLDLAHQALDAGELVDELSFIAGRTQHVIDRSPARWYVGPCDLCSTSMYAPPDAEHVLCPNPDCVTTTQLADQAVRTSYDVRKRREWLLDAAQDYMVTAAEASRAVPMLAPPGTRWNYSTFRSALGKEVHPDRTHPDGRPRYRLGDCIAWAQAKSEARAVGQDGDAHDGEAA